jgi:hypothetical protein
MIAGLALAACGSASTSARTEEARFLAKGNAICATGQAKLRRAERLLEADHSVASRAAAFVRDTVVPVIRSDIDGISALTPPAGGQTAVSTMLRAAQVELFRLEHGSPRLVAERTTLSGFARLAHAYGLTACLPQVR